ncbi:MAG TPA: lipocalin-like domain-containing protein [Casimicrobiaceae bacterium]
MGSAMHHDWRAMRAGAHSRLRRRLLALGLAPLTATLPVRLAHAAVDYPDVHAGTRLEFPADFGAHPRFRVEWWYVTGWLGSASRSYGFQVTFFRVRPGIAEDNPSRFTPKELLFAHAAVAEPVLGRLRVAQRAAREGFTLAGAQEGSTHVWIDDWSLVRAGDAYRATVRAPDFAFDLALAPTQPVLLEGDAGVSRKGPEPREASFYYSEPQLAVRGTLAIEGDAQHVDGVAWLDHEWSSDYLGAGAVGWDWTGINLADGGALMAFRIRDTAGNPSWAGGTLRDARGHRTTFGPADVTFTPLRQWTSPRTRIEYPVAMRIRAGDLDVTLEPLFDDQELDARASVGAVYWEGAVRALVSGRVAGRGYLELTGYGAPLRL